MSHGDAPGAQELYVTASVALARRYAVSTAEHAPFRNADRRGMWAAPRGTVLRVGERAFKPYPCPRAYARARASPRPSRCARTPRGRCRPKGHGEGARDRGGEGASSAGVASAPTRSARRELRSETPALAGAEIPFDDRRQARSGSSPSCARRNQATTAVASPAGSGRQATLQRTMAFS